MENSNIQKIIGYFDGKSFSGFDTYAEIYEDRESVLIKAVKGNCQMVERLSIDTVNRMSNVQYIIDSIERKYSKFVTPEEISQMKKASKTILDVWDRLREQGLAGDDYIMINDKEIGCYYGCHPFEFLEDIIKLDI